MDKLFNFWAVGDGFWSRQPALFFGCAVFLGAWVAVARESLGMADLFLAGAVVVAFSPRRLLCLFFIALVSLVTTQFRVQAARQGVFSGTVVAEVTERRLTTFHKRPFWHMTLFIHDFSTPSGHCVARGICLPLTTPPPCPLYGGVVYRFPATVSVEEGGRTLLRPTLAQCQDTGKRTVSCVEWRVWLRRHLERLFGDLFPDESVRHVAGALTFGLYKDSSLQQAMHRAGVEHVLAISGFHFGIVAALTVYCMGFLPSRWRAAGAMLLLTVYLFMIGPLPSVIRAWCSAMIILGSLFLYRAASGINCLGVGLIVAVLYDPTFVVHIGFQLSFLATATILFFSQDTRRMLARLIPTRSTRGLEPFSVLDQVLFGVLRWLLPVFSLLIPVTLVIIPYQMAFLQDFSTVGCLYNLVIPMVFSLAMPPILLAVLAHPFHILAQGFAAVAEPFLRLGLVLVNNTPETSWALVSGGSIPEAVGRMIIVTVFLYGMYRHGSGALEHNEAWKACL